ncbi:MAG: hypothetical protein ACFE0I_16340 [Elainellaceae cyanobacterium]
MTIIDARMPSLLNGRSPSIPHLSTVLLEAPTSELETLSLELKTPTSELETSSSELKTPTLELETSTLLLQT